MSNTQDAEGEKMPMNLNGSPWWLRLVLQVGVGTVIAFMLLTWLQKSVDQKLDESLMLGRQTAQAQAFANSTMGAFAETQTRQTELLLLVQRQICANTAKTDDARDRCYATRIK